jgi:hypothetical protein
MATQESEEPKIALKPFTLDTLSIHALFHVKAACPSLFEDNFISSDEVPEVSLLLVSP